MLDSISCFDKTPTCDGRTDGQTDTGPWLVPRKKKYWLSQMDPRDALPRAYRVVHRQEDAECDKLAKVVVGQMSSVGNFQVDR